MKHIATLRTAELSFYRTGGRNTLVVTWSDKSDLAELLFETRRGDRLISLLEFYGGVEVALHEQFGVVAPGDNGRCELRLAARLPDVAETAEPAPF
jgi:hypothetical protein